MNILRIFQSPKSLSKEIDKEIESRKSYINHDVQVIESGSRVMQNMSSAIRLMSEKNDVKDY